MSHELLGNHKASANWYTPDYIWELLEKTVEVTRDFIYDPCPATDNFEVNGLETDWYLEAVKLNPNGMPIVYVNPPTPAACFAQKALETAELHGDITLIFAAFSEAVMWQKTELMDHRVCWVRNRINWIDGRRFITAKTNDAYDIFFDKETNKYLRPNPEYLKASKSPRNYNCFIAMSNMCSVNKNFHKYFSPLGEVRESYRVII